MNNDFLKSRLQRVARRYQWVDLWRRLAACWAVAALVAVAAVFLQRATGQTWPLALPLLLAIAAGVAVVQMFVSFSKSPDSRWIARKIEARHPELNGVLLTAIQQEGDPKQEAGYLQYRVIQEATAHSQKQDWRKVVPGSRFVVGQAVHLFALGCFLFALSGLRVAPIHGEAPKWIGGDGVSVTPGDTTIERGDSLVVLARFGGALPPNVSLVIRENGAAPRSVTLVKSLADPVFGGSVPEVANDLAYHLEYRGEKTREFKVTVFEHPKLVRSDVDLKFPGYTKLAPKHIEDTRRVSAVEGTSLDFALQLNKPVQSAKLVARNQEKTEVPLVVSPGQALATLGAFVPTKSLTYDLQLIDAEGRANKVAAPFVIDVQPNRAPEIKLASPRGDVRPSALEEVAFEGTVWDDFGTGAFGLAYSLAGAEPKYLELGRDGAAKEKKSFSHLMKLEELGAKPDDLISWFAWADDTGPDGKVRRTSGDLYFAEVRPFDEIFRESQNMESGEQEQQQQGGQRNQARKLTELQKQIISATWKLQRTGAIPSYAEDAKVVSDAQAQALAQAEETAEEARSPRQQTLWKTVTSEMEKAIEKLKDAAKEPAPLAQALPAEQAAYQALLKLQARETNVTRRNSKGGGGGGGGANQRQIDQLDLKQSENRYETQRQAKAPENKERREQLAVMNRLQELARRQQDLNERLKELQTALQEAQSEKEREDVRRRLKRLEEEQRQMLADADEVKQRMDRQENQSNMADQRQQLDQTRQDIQKAAEAAADGSVAQALAAGTRAQRQLQQMRDEMRKQNSSQFAEDLREMRNEARELARQQEEVGQKIDELANGGKSQRKSLSDPGDSKELADKLAEQKERMNNLVNKATQISEQAENTEPLLSRQLYDSVRKVTQDDTNAVKQARSELLNSGRLSRELYDRLQKMADGEESGKALDLTRALLNEGNLPQARQAGQRARGEIEDLKRGVERAAESVLGDDAEQLKLAQSELDSLTDQLKREIAQAGGAAQPEGAKPGQTGRRGPAADQRQAGAQGENDPAASGREGAEPGQQPGSGQAGETGQGAQPGKAGDRAQKMAGGKQSGKQPGQQPGQQPGEGGQQPGQGASEQTAQADGQPGGGGGQSGGDSPTQAGQRGAQPGQVADGRAQRPQPGGNQRGGGNRGGNFNLDNIFNGGGADFGGNFGGFEDGRVNVGPITGGDFNRWSERVRDVGDLVDTPEMRKAVAAALERARMLRRDFRQDQKKPDWTVVKLEILQPLVEVRNRVAEELARRDNKESLAPIDRDPVPTRFAESVRRYYEELGKDK